MVQEGAPDKPRKPTPLTYLKVKKFKCYRARLMTNPVVAMTRIILMTKILMECSSPGKRKVERRKVAMLMKMMVSKLPSPTTASQSSLLHLFLTIHKLTTPGSNALKWLLRASLISRCSNRIWHRCFTLTYSFWFWSSF